MANASGVPVILPSIAKAKRLLAYVEKHPAGMPESAAAIREGIRKVEKKKA